MFSVLVMLVFFCGVWFEVVVRCMLDSISGFQGFGLMGTERLEISGCVLIGVCKLHVSLESTCMLLYSI